MSRDLGSEILFLHNREGQKMESGVRLKLFYTAWDLLVESLYFCFLLLVVANYLLNSRVFRANVCLSPVIYLS